MLFIVCCVFYNVTQRWGQDQSICPVICLQSTSSSQLCVIHTNVILCDHLKYYIRPPELPVKLLHFLPSLILMHCSLPFKLLQHLNIQLHASGGPYSVTGKHRYHDNTDNIHDNSFILKPRILPSWFYI